MFLPFFYFMGAMMRNKWWEGRFFLKKMGVFGRWGYGGDTGKGMIVKLEMPCHRKRFCG